MNQTCHALTVANTQWDFCPSHAAAYIMLVCFIIATGAHIAQTLIYRKHYCWIIVISGLLQTLAYLLRILSISNPDSLPLYSGWFVLILIAPIFTNAFVYMILGRMVWNFTKDGKVLRLSSWRLGQMFVTLDIMYLSIAPSWVPILTLRSAAIIQIYGAGTAADSHQPLATTMRGLHIYMGGIAFQLFFICIFFFFSMSFHKMLDCGDASPAFKRKIMMLLYTMYITVILIGARIVFRLIEYSSGLNSAIPRHEVYQYCFDSLLMLIASTMFNVSHPGALMPGKAGDMPTRKERKKAGKGSVDHILLDSQRTSVV